MTTSLVQDALLANFATLAYQSPAQLNAPGVLPSGWSLKVSAVDEATGFAAFAFKNESTGEVVIAYRGTDGVSDLGPDSAIATGSWHPRFDQAIEFAGKVTNTPGMIPEGSAPQSVISVTGHSLGGAEAQVVSQAYGYNGAAFDPGAAGRIVQTDGFQNAVANNGLPPGGVGVPNTFTNHVVQGSGVSSMTGEHVGNVSVLPTLSFNGTQALGSFLIGLVNPALGAMTLVGVDQFVNKHSSEQISQSMSLLAGNGTLPEGGVTLQPKLIGWNYNDATGESTPRYSSTEFEVRNAQGELTQIIEFNGQSETRQLKVYSPDGVLQSTTTVSLTGTVTVQPIGIGDVPDGVPLAPVEGAAGPSVSVTQTDANGEVVASFSTEDAQDGGAAVLQGILDAFSAPLPPAGTGIQIADNGEDVWTDGGLQSGGGLPDPAPQPPPPLTGNYTEYLDNSGLTPTQQQALGQWLNGAGVGGVDNVGFVPLPGGGTVLMQNADGDIVGELTRNADGSLAISGIDGSAHVLTDSGQLITQEQYNAQNASAAVNLFQSILSAEHWSEMSDGQRAAALLGIYNAGDALTGGNLLPGDVGDLATLIGFMNTLETGDDAHKLYSSLQVVEQFTRTADSAGLISNTFGGAFLPTFGFVLALDSGDPVSILSSGANLLGVLGVLPYGQVVGLVISLLDMVLSEPPVVQGQASMGWDDQGQLVAQVDNSSHGGGAIAQAQAEGLGLGIETGLQTQQETQGIPPEQQVALNPDNMPVVGYHSQYETTRTLSWTDANGETHTRYYDENGNHPSGSTMAQDYVQMVLQGGALAPAWLIAGAQGQYSQLSQEAAAIETEIENLEQQAQALGPQTVVHGGGEGAWEETIPPADPEAYAQVLAQIEEKKEQASALREEAQGVLHAIPSTPDLYQQGQLSEDGLSQTLSVITLEMPATGTPTAVASDSPSALLNLDADAYLERSEWVEANQAVLGIDLSGNGQLEATELLHGDLAWLDSNNDGRIDSQDPAYGAIKLWLDVNSDGRSVHRAADGSPVDETQSLAQAGISAIVITADGMHIERADGSTQDLSEQDLTGDTRGVIYSTHEDAAGLLQTTEQADGSGQTVLLAANTREFDGQAEHTHGGEVVWAPGVEQEVQIGVGDERLSSTTFYSAESASTQTHVVLGQGDANWQDGQAGQVLSGQVSGQQTQAQLTAQAVVGDIPVNSQIWTTGSGQVVVSDAPAQAPQPVAGGWQVVDTVPAAQAASSAPVNASEMPDVSVTVLAGQVSGQQVPMQVAGEALHDGAMGEVQAGQAPGTVAGPAQQVSADAVQSNGQVFTTPESATTAASVVAAGDIRITSEPTPPRPRAQVATPVVFVPSAASSLVQGWQNVTAEMLASASAGVLGGGSSPLLALAVGVGTAALAPSVLAAAGGTALPSSAAGLMPQEMGWQGLPVAGVTGSTTGAHALVPTGAALLGGSAGGVAPQTGVAPAGAEGQGASTNSAIQWQHLRAEDAVGGFEDGATQPLGTATGGATVGGLSGVPLSTGGAGAATLFAPDADAPAAPQLSNLQLRSAEDLGLLLDAGYLFAMGGVDGSLGGQGLKLQGVGAPEHGQVALQTVMGPDGVPVQQVVFVPDPDHHGEAGFSFVVVNAWGLEQTVQVILHVDPADDAPRVLGEALQAEEDRGLVFSPELLLANDVDPDASSGPSQLRITRVGDAVNGQVWLGSDGQVYFAPDADHAGPAQFTYWVTNGSGLETPAQVHMDLLPVNDAPVVVGERVQGLEDQALLFTPAALLANDTDADSPAAALRIVAVGGASQGTVELLGNGSVLFTPTPNYFGTASFTYTVADEYGATSSATVHIDVAGVNDAPVVIGEDIAGTEDTALWLDATLLLANDSDIDSPQAALRITWVGNATQGTVFMDENGHIQFVPAVNFNSSSGVATFSYTVSDGVGGSTTGVARVVLAPVNDAPVATGERLDNVPEDTVLVFTPQDLLANDSDVDIPANAQVLRVSAVGNAQHGTVALREDGSVVFTPEGNYFGPARFSYVVDDGAGGQAQAWMDVNLVSVNDAPQAQADEVLTSEDQGVLLRPVDLLANDSDVDGPHDALRLVWVGGATNGQVEQLPSGDIRFAPEPNFEGTASFRYQVDDGQGGLTEATVLVHVAAVNDVPVAANDVLPDQHEDVPLVITATSLLGNDLDVDVLTSGQVLRITGVLPVAGETHGVLSLDADGNVRFVPEAHYVGPVRFAYTVEDGVGGMARAEVSFALLNVNDAPVVAGEFLVAKNQSELLIEPVALLANDWDLDTPHTGDVLSVISVGAATHGTVTLLADGQIHFVFESGFIGVGQFDYVVSDGMGGQTTATARVSNTNLAPVVLGETITLSEDVVGTLAPALLLANDSDPDNLTSDLRILSVGNASHGSVSLDAQGAIVFTPEPNYFGAAQFTYTVGDGEGGLTVGTATLDINAVNDAPTVQGEQLSIQEDQILHLSGADLLTNDTDVDGPGPLTLVGVGNASGGSVVLSGGSVVFTPALNFSGAASFSYTVSDGAGGISQAQVNLQIAPVNDAPVANDEHLANGFQDQVFEISAAALLANDVDLETPGALSIAQVMDAQHGTVSMDATGTIRFVPEPGYFGVASFSYVVTDPDGLTSVGTTTIGLQRLNLSPLAVDDSFNGLEDVPFLISPSQLLVNDNDDMGLANLNVTAVRNADHGTVELLPDGQMRFVPEANYNGPAQFQYQVSDAEGASTWATAYLAVASVNDAPEVEAVWYGTPIYGYQHIWVEVHWDSGEPGWDITKVYNEAQAQSLGSDLKDLSGNTITPNYLPQSGAMVPVTFEQADAGFLYGNNAQPLDDVSQDSGRVLAYDLDSSGGFTYSIVGDLTTHGGASVDASGNWHYSSNALDPYHGPDSFKVRITDAQGAFVDVQIDTHHAGQGYVPPDPDPEDIFVSPVAVDMDGDGLELIAAEASPVVADMDGDGSAEHVAWVGPDDAVLVYDQNKDSLVDVTNEVSFVQYLPGAQTDLEGLRAFDSNSNGFLDVGDALWTDFGLWQDANGNGVQDEGEFTRLDDAGIVSVSLVRTGTPQEINGNVVFGVSTVQLSDGSVVQASDVMFRAVPTPIALDNPEESEAVTAVEPLPLVLDDEPIATVTKEVDASVAEAFVGEAVLEPVLSESLLSTHDSVAPDAVSEIAEEADIAADPVAVQALAMDDPEVALGEVATHVPESPWSQEGTTQLPQVGADLASEAEVVQMAQLFTQWSNTTTQDAPPVAFVPSSDAAWGAVPDDALSLPVANTETPQPVPATGTSG